MTNLILFLLVLATARRGESEIGKVLIGKSKAKLKMTASKKGIFLRAKKDIDSIERTSQSALPEQTEEEEHIEEEEGQKVDQAFLRNELKSIVHQQATLQRELMRFSSQYSAFKNSQDNNDFRSHGVIEELKGGLKRLRAEGESLEERLKALENSLIDFHHQHLDQDRNDLELQNKQRKSFLRLIRRFKAARAKERQSAQELAKDYSQLQEESEEFLAQANS